jgi:hypothetical protein
MAEYQNTFLGANLEFPNLGVHFLLAEIVKFRKQLTVRQEFRSQSGWNDGLNRYMVTELEKLADTLENITYNPDSFTLEELEAQAGDTSRSLDEDYNEYALTQDNVLMPVGVNRTLSWDLTGTDVDMPQLSPQNCPNDYARTFVAALDNFFVELTRLDSRHQPYAITKYESVMMRSLLNVLYTLTQRKGGEVNRSDVPTGTLPSDEGGTFRAGRA